MVDAGFTLGLALGFCIGALTGVLIFNSRDNWRP